MSDDSGLTATFSHETYCGQLTVEIERLARLIDTADPRLKVPACPRWTITRLAHHTGSIHRWATGLVLGHARRMRRIADTDDWQRGMTPAEQADWLRAGAAPLLAALGSADPDEPMWAWGQDQRVRFWSRRMVHETGIHRADAELALGVEPSFEPSIASDGVSEFFDNLWRARVFRREIGKLRGHGETLRFVATDTTEQWTVHLDDTRVRARREVAHRVPRADVRIGGTAVDLYLLVWHRRDLDRRRFRITGERTLLDRWQAGSAV